MRPTSGRLPMLKNRASTCRLVHSCPIMSRRMPACRRVERLRTRITADVFSHPGVLGHGQAMAHKKQQKKTPRTTSAKGLKGSDSLPSADKADVYSMLVETLQQKYMQSWTFKPASLRNYEGPGCVHEQIHSGRRGANHFGSDGCQVPGRNDCMWSVVCVLTEVEESGQQPCMASAPEVPKSRFSTNKCLPELFQKLRVGGMLHVASASYACVNSRRDAEWDPA